MDFETLLVRIQLTRKLKLSTSFVFLSSSFLHLDLRERGASASASASSSAAEIETVIHFAAYLIRSTHRSLAMAGRVSLQLASWLVVVWLHFYNY